MKKILLLIALLALVLAVCAQRWKKIGQWKRNKCFIQNCKKPKCFGPPTCNECDRGFVRVQAPLGFACALECPSTHKNVRGTCVEACTPNCKDCKTGSCSVCERGYALFKARCIRRCPKGYQTKVNPTDGKKCVKSCTPNCKDCKTGSCSVCKRGYALFKARCIRRCPKGYQTKVNPMDGKKCVKSCTPNCKDCKTGSCSVCERGYALFKARCIRRCPKGYQTKVNLIDGKKCVKSCKVMDCEFCPKWNTLKCFKCKHDLYKLSSGRQDFCFSHCPSGYVPKTLNGANFCKKAQPTIAKTPDQTPQPESTATQNHTPNPPEPGTTPTTKSKPDELTTEAESGTSGIPYELTNVPTEVPTEYFYTTGAVTTDPEPTTFEFVDEDLWP